MISQTPLVESFLRRVGEPPRHTMENENGDNAGTSLRPRPNGRTVSERRVQTRGEELVSCEFLHVLYVCWTDCKGVVSLEGH